MIMEIRIPDIGDFANVPVMEILVKPGDDVTVDQTLLVLESDKATLDVPSPVAGRIDSVLVDPGARVSKGTAIATIAPSRERTSTPPPAGSSGVANEQDASPADQSPNQPLVVIGGGPGGYSAAFRAADLGLDVVLIEREAKLGGVCLNVGCIPSKALLHVAAVKTEAERLSIAGLRFGPAEIDLERLRAFKGATVNRLTAGLQHMARQRGVNVITGEARFVDAHRLRLTLADGREQSVGFSQCIVAAGSAPVHLSALPTDPRIVDSTGALEVPFVPARLLVIGGGIIGLEMATVYAALGSRVDIVERADTLLPGIDRDLVGIWQKENAPRLGRIFLGCSVESATAGPAGVSVRLSGQDEPRTYDLVLQAAGRRPNGLALGLEQAGVATDPRGFITVDRRMRSSNPQIFAIGDVAGEPMLAHKAVHEGHTAAEVAAGHPSAFDATVIPGVAYTDPEIAWVGVSEIQAQESLRPVSVAKFPWSASGRAIANGAAFGMTKLLFDRESGRVIGGAIVGPNAGDMIGELCLAIEMGADAADIGHTIHPHPTLGETIGLAAEAAEGRCTDLPPTARTR